tara:strand:+ start:596 stop:769 length:174 start_codon:yes stop_codon:yes gene_type:complete
VASKSAAFRKIALDNRKTKGQILSDNPSEQIPKKKIKYTVYQRQDEEYEVDNIQCIT